MSVKTKVEEIKAKEAGQEKLIIPKVPESVNPNKDKLLIMGFSPTTVKDGLDFIKKYPGCEVWCMNMFYVADNFPLQLATRWFEIHEVPENASVSYDSDEGRIHRQNLKGIPIPIYVQDKEKYWTDFPQDKLIEFPAKEIVDYFPRAYFSSTPSWILAFAMIEGIKEYEKNGKFRWSNICMAGVDMMAGWNRKYVVQSDGSQKVEDVVSSEYAMQRPSVEWLVGMFDVLKLLKIDCDFYIPRGSTLMKYNRLYGYENYFNQGITLEIKKRLEMRLAFLQQHLNNLKNNFSAVQQKMNNELIAIQRQMDAGVGGIQEAELLYSEFAEPSTYFYKEKEVKK